MIEPKGFTLMKVHRLVLDPTTNSPIVILQDPLTGWLLPIWIGLFEAHAIAMKMEGVPSSRPLTHDLFCNFIQVSHALLERVEVTDMLENTFFARILFVLNDQEHAIDSRPSDAIALAIRTATPIFVANQVLAQAKIDPAQFQEANDDQKSEGERTDDLMQKFHTPNKVTVN